jgi:hypothetical protein
MLIPFGPVSLAFNVSETEGSPLLQEAIPPFETRGLLPQHVYDRTLENCRKDFIPVHETDFDL